MPSHSSMSEDGNWRQGRSWQAAMWFARPGFMLLDEPYRMGTHFQDLWPRGARIARCHGHDACGTSHKKTEVPSAPHSRGPCYWASSSSGAKRYLTCSREHGRNCTFSKGFNASLRSRLAATVSKTVLRAQHGLVKSRAKYRLAHVRSSQGLNCTFLRGAIAVNVVILVIAVLPNTCGQRRFQEPLFNVTENA